MDCFSFPSRLDSGAGGGVGFRPTGTDCPIVYCSPPSPQKRREIYQSTPSQMLYKNKTTDVLIIFQVPPCSPPFFKNKNNNTSHFYVSLPTRSLRAIWRGKWSCFSWTIFRFRFQQLVFPTLWLFRTAAERANCRVRTLLCTGGVRTSTFLFWRSLRSVRAECRDELFIGTRPPAPSYNPCVTSVDVKRQGGGNVSAPQQAVLFQIAYLFHTKLHYVRKTCCVPIKSMEGRKELFYAQSISTVMKSMASV